MTTSGSSQLGIAKPLLAWSTEHLRSFPWRDTRDPWVVLVSEVMLQQTQAKRVAERLPGFLARFPTPGAMASATLGDVLEAWVGLGYNRRAQRLKAAAELLVERFGGEVPNALDELLSLPGLGPYTARAVAVFAFDAPIGVVDTNTARVFKRFSVDPAIRPRELQELVDAEVPPRASWRFNSALLDLGATTCTARVPRCDACPLASRCSWRGGAHGGEDPAASGVHAPVAQVAFAGSSREARGRLVAALVEGELDVASIARVTGRSREEAREVANGLVADGLVERHGRKLRLAGR